VPTVFAGFGGRTVFTEAGRVWDCGRWQPGDPRTEPSATEVALACEAIAHLHGVWAGETQRGPCPGVQNRLRALAENEPLLLAGPDALPPVSPILNQLLRRAVLVAARAAPLAVRALRPWEHQTVVLQPSVRDLRGEHVLFNDGRVSGIIDFGAMAFDHPAVDLARFFDDFAETDDTLFAAGMNAYRAAHGAFEASDEFVRVLARTGAVCSVLGWLVRLAVRREPLADPLAVAARLDLLLARVARIAHFSR
jgi:homoserine kinase type II